MRLVSTGPANTDVRAVAFLALLLALAPAVAGCAKSSLQRDPPAGCTKLGDSCTYAPGKLGVCVEPVDGRRGLVCQSQH